jgi:hypothetical protein
MNEPKCGSVAVEVGVRGVVLMLAGLSLVLIGMIDDVSGALSGASVGMVLFGGLLWYQWRPLVRRAVQHAKPMVKNVKIIAPKCIAATCAVELAVFIIPLVLVILLVPLGGKQIGPGGDGLIGGILLVTGMLLVGGYGWLTKWEKEHYKLIVRETGICKLLRKRDRTRAWQFFVIQHVY